MGILDAIERVESHEPRPFIAPVLDSNINEVFVVQDGIPHTFRCPSHEPGWYRLCPSKSRGQSEWLLSLAIRYAYPHEYIPYLEALPRFYVIACFPLSEDTWLTVPFNASDASQRGWPNGEPKPVHLVHGIVLPFDVLTTRSLAGTLLFEQVCTRLDTAWSEVCIFNTLALDRKSMTDVPTDWNSALQITLARRHAARVEEHERRRVEALGTVEGQIKDRLEFMGASLVNWCDTSDGYEVTWEYDNCKHTVTIQRNMMLQSAGICLDGSAPEHSLSSAVQLLQTARSEHRFDLPESSWI